MTSFIFPGQGSQFVGMAKDFHDNFSIAKSKFEEIEDFTSLNIRRIIFENDENKLDLTQFTQICIFATSYVIFHTYLNEKKPQINVSSSELFETIKEILSRPNYKTNHLIDFEELSTQERIQILLKFLEKQNIVTFSKTLRKNEGKKGVVVTLLASLELAKDGYLELIQNKSDELFLKSRGI